MDLSHIARREVFSAAWAREHGLDSDAIARAVAAGRAHPLFRGWYAVRPPVDDVDWNRLAARAAYLHFDGRAMVSNQSALLWHSLPVLYADLRTIHLTRTIPGSSRRRRPVVIHRALPGLPVADRVPAAVAIVQAGLTGQPLTALVAADAALHEGKVDRAELDAALELLARHRGVSPVRACLRHADARTETPGETILGYRLRQLGWDIEPQFEVVTEHGPRFADFRIKGTRVLVEFDGKVKYRGDRGVDVLFSEKRREDSIRRQGWFFERFVWAEVDDLALIDRRVRETVTVAAAA
ncbi:hypothetical protein GCM10027053_14530 [Intrasporangium mesophilum]